MSNKKEITVDATLDNLDIVMGFLEDILREKDCPLKIMMKIAVAFEEIYVNIVNYAYGDTVGECTIEAFVVEPEETCQYSKKVIIKIKDNGVEFNPLSMEDPDISLSAEDREIGGLGIYMTKKTMDRVDYLRNNDENVLVMEKSW